MTIKKDYIAVFAADFSCPATILLAELQDVGAR